MTFIEKTKIHINNKTYFLNLKKYVSLIEKYNKVMNLTGFKEDKIWEEGIYESILSLENAFSKNGKGKLLDIGAGAGFPSVPYLIVNPEINLTIFEPQVKRIKFLEIVKKELNLNITLINKRVEDVKDSEQYDFVTARAVSSLKNLLQASAHIAKVGGIFGFIKGPKYNQEIKEAEQILKELNFPLENKYLKINNKNIWIIKIFKDKSSPSKYPLLWKDIKS